MFSFMVFFYLFQGTKLQKTMETAKFSISPPTKTAIFVGNDTFLL